MVRILDGELERLESDVHRFLAANDFDGLRTSLSDHHPADIADIVERLDDDDRLRLFQLLPLNQAAEVLHELGAHATHQLIDDLPSDHVGDLLDLLPMDDAVELLTEDVPERQEEFLALMEPDDAAEVQDLLKYPSDSAGRLMTEKFVHVPPHLTAAQTIDFLRKVDSQVETLNDLYILNGDRQLLGVVSLRQIITAPPDARLSDMMITDVISVQPETDQEEVARMVSRYDFLALPVVTPDNRMLGIITVDDVLDILVRETNEDMLRFSGVEGGGLMDQPYFTLPILSVVRKRFGWLILLFLAETLTGSVLRLFEDELAQVVALSFFIPLLIGTGGNTGAQTVSTIIRSLAMKEIRFRDTGRVIIRELGAGLLLGLALGVVGFVRTMLWGGLDLRFCLVIGLSLTVICTWANTIGSLIPLVAARFRIDPAIVSAPLITTLVDATGLAIYLLIAKSLLSL